MLGVFKQCELTHRSVCTCSMCVYPPLRPICFARNNMAVKAKRHGAQKKPYSISYLFSLSSKNSTAHSSNIVTNEWIEGERERLTNWRKVYWRPLSTQTHQWKVGYKVSQLTAKVGFEFHYIFYTKSGKDTYFTLVYPFMPFPLGLFEHVFSTKGCYALYTRTL